MAHANILETQPLPSYRSSPPRLPFAVEEYTDMVSWGRTFYVTRPGANEPRVWVHISHPDARRADECTCHSVKPCEHIEAARRYMQRNG
jgi:hypothetical protein